MRTNAARRSCVYDEETHKEFPGTEIQKDDVLLNITGASIGRTAIAEASLIGGNVNQHVCIIRANTNRAVPRFINLLLLSAIGRRQIDSFQAGGNREGLNFSQIESIKLPFPPSKAEQEVIAEVLSDDDRRNTVRIPVGCRRDQRPEPKIAARVTARLAARVTARVAPGGKSRLGFRYGIDGQGSDTERDLPSMNDNVGQPERATQNRVIALFSQELGYRYLGDWSDRSGNSNIEEAILANHLTRSGYTEAEINGAIYKLKTEANHHGRGW